MLLLALVLVRRRSQLQLCHGLRPETGRFREQVRVIGQTAPLHVNLYVPAEPVLEIADGGGQMGQQVIFAVGPQMDRQLVPLQRPVGPGQRRGRHGIDPIQDPGQFRKVHLGKTLTGKPRVQLHPPDGKLFFQRPLRLPQTFGGDILGHGQIDGHSPALHINFRMANGSLLKSRLLFLRRRVAPEHIEKINGFFHGYSCSM